VWQKKRKKAGKRSQKVAIPGNPQEEKRDVNGDQKPSGGRKKR